MSHNHLAQLNALSSRLQRPIPPSLRKDSLDARMHARLASIQFVCEELLTLISSNRQDNEFNSQLLSIKRRAQQKFSLANNTHDLNRWCQNNTRILDTVILSLKKSTPGGGSTISALSDSQQRRCLNAL